MSKEDMFNGFSMKDINDHKKKYTKEVKEKYGETSAYKESEIKTISLVEKEKDFVVVLSTITSPTSSVTMEKVGTGSSIFGLNKQIESGQINIKGKDGKYQYNMITERERSPLNGFSDFETKGNNIVVVIYSTARKGDNDKNIINLNINNETDKKVYVYVIGDDEKLPRCSVTKGGNNVYVEKL